jgi:hypothetical protein
MMKGYDILFRGDGLKACKLGFVLCFLLFMAEPVHGSEQDGNNVDQFLSTLFLIRTNLLLTLNPEVIDIYYNRDVASSDQAYLQEVQRSNYLNAWADNRDITLLSAESKVEILEKKMIGNEAIVIMKHDEIIQYLHKNQWFPFGIETFKLGTLHNMVLKKSNDSWIVVQDSFSDPIADHPGLIPKYNFVQHWPSIQDAASEPSVINQTVGTKYNREKAVKYADKYSGFSQTQDKRGEYNHKYRNFNELGGDCTSFASQVLGDKEEGGGLPMTKDWYYHHGDASESWSHTDSFLHFLKTSGYGEVVKVGLFQEVTAPTPDHPNGVISKLQPGDLIGYEEKKDLVHFSIVVGTDSQGYPLVNSHTADRFHVPWDLGWDKETTFWLIHIKDH